MFSGPIEDRLAIREVNDHYADAVCRKNAEDWGGAWAEDAVWSLMGTKVEGKEAIVGLWSQAMSAFDAVSFHAIPCAIEINGNKATSRCQTQEILKDADGTRIAGGFYIDELEKRDGKWLFTSRDFSLIVEHKG